MIGGAKAIETAALPRKRRHLFLGGQRPTKMFRVGMETGFFPTVKTVLEGFDKRQHFWNSLVERDV